MIEIIEKNGVRSEREEEAREDEDVVVISVASSCRKSSIFLSLRRNAHSLAWIMNHRAPVARENDEKNWPVVGRRDDNGSRLQAGTRGESWEGAIKSSGYPFHALFPP